MPDEKLEFSMQDLGRLAWHLGDREILRQIVRWVQDHGGPEDAARAERAIVDTYIEERENARAVRR